ncbi:MAG: hypothetical protein R3D69_05995 [Xanthobacteraceae bacterium]
MPDSEIRASMARISTGLNVAMMSRDRFHTRFGMIVGVFANHVMPVPFPSAIA